MSGTGRLILLCGLPGSGKTTTARRLATELDALRLCPDEWMADLGIEHRDADARMRVEALQWRLAEDLLGHGMTVIVEWGLWSRAERALIRRRARELAATVELHHLDVPIEDLWRRLDERNRRAGPGTVVIGRDELERWAAMFEPPTAEEQAQFD